MNLRHLREYWPLAVIAFMPLIGFLTVVNLCLELGKPYGGFLAIWYPPRLAWSTHPVTPQWWPTLQKSGLRYGDSLISVDGDPGPGNYATYARAVSAGRTQVQLDVLRVNSRQRISIPLQRFTLNNLLPDLISGLCYWLLALAVFLSRPQGAVHRAFGIASSAFAGLIWLTVCSLGLEPQGVIGNLCEYLFDMATPFMGITWVHLALVFPCKVQRFPRRLLLGLYTSAIVAFLFGSAGFVARWCFGVRRSDLDLVAVVMAASIDGTCLAWFIGRPLWLATQSRVARRVRQQAWVLLAGVGVAAPFMVNELARWFDARGYCWLGVDTRWALLPLAISVSVVIVRYHSFTKLPSTILLALMLATSAALANVVAFALRVARPRAAEDFGVLLFVGLMATALFASSMWRLQTSWRGGFARLLHWDRVSYSAARRFGQDVVRQDSLFRRLPETIANALVTQLGLERAAVWMWDETHGALVLAASTGDWPRAAPQRLEQDALRIDNGGPPVCFDHDRAAQLFGSRLQVPLVEVLEPLWVSGKLVGALGLGKRWEDETFDARDLEIVALVAQQSALFLLTAVQVEQLHQVPNQIAAIQERERFKIAQELHDTIQQFLGRLPFLLEVSRQAAADNPEEAQAMLQNCIAEVELAAATVRELQSYLAPRHLEKGLTRPLRLLLDRFSLRTGIAIENRISPAIDQMLSLDARHALYRVVQQALDNIAAHAQANHVDMQITVENSRVSFAVVDDGHGFSAEDRNRAEERGSFGLKSMSARITSLQGEFFIEGSSSVGTRVSGWLPVAPLMSSARQLPA